ncbi:MAG: hypothetical protein FWG83_07580, partial [Oscillospiraceae bacterium]|nr:hypothetical protein [Oscillospiraceae bacterium]
MKILGLFISLCLLVLTACSEGKPPSSEGSNIDSSSSTEEESPAPVKVDVDISVMSGTMAHAA